MADNSGIIMPPEFCRHFVKNTAETGKTDIRSDEESFTAAQAADQETALF